MKRFLFGAALFAAVIIAIPLSGQDKKPALVKNSTGLVVPKDIDKRHQDSWEVHGHRLKALPTVTASTWDCRALGYVPPVQNQGDCGICHAFSGKSPAEMLLIKAGYGKPDGTFTLSVQYILDCLNTGGCNGGWPEDTAKALKTKGLPTTAEYGAYTATEGTCKSVASMTMYTIADYGYVGQSSGVPSVQAIKDAIVRFGPLSAAVAVDPAFQRYSSGVFKDTGYRQVNHAIVILGWDDSKQAWLVRNQWTDQWGIQGYAWVAYNANCIGYAAMWMTVNPLPPVPPAPSPNPLPKRLFTLTFPRSLEPGDMIHSFRTPVAIPAGSYWVIPAPTTPQNVVPTK